ncbi:MAG TPA: hypothetical protein VLB29_13520 [Nocardioidaceae bacterium]|nr:hypothetical protein [Nocardioidaceae bacterium]
MNSGTPMVAGLTRAIWTNAVLATGIVLTALTGLVVGYGSVWFQIGGGPDAEDYRVSAGGYAAAAVVLIVTLPAIVAFRGARILLAGTSVVAALDAVLAVRSVRLAAGTSDPGPGINTALDGFGAVVAMPWTWVLVLLGLAGSALLVSRATTRRLPQGPHSPAR